MNTGWTGGKYGVGSRMSLKDTRQILENIHNGCNVCIVLVGEYLIGSCESLVNEGDFVQAGELIGLFKYGGSTVIIMSDELHFDEDLMENTLPVFVNIGESIAQFSKKS